MNTVNAKKAIKDCMKANLVPFLLGSPGTSKSSLVAQIAEEENMILVDLRLAQMDAVDIGGLPYPEEEYGTFSYYTLDMFPVKGLVDKPKRDVLILLDELSCHDSQTEVLTSSGFQLFSEWDGSPVAQYDIATAIIDYAKPIKVINQHYKGDMHTITTSANNFSITPIHDLLVNKVKVKVKDIVIANYNKMPVAGISVGSKKTLTLFEKAAITYQADGTSCHPYTNTQVLEGCALGSKIGWESKRGTSQLEGCCTLNFAFKSTRKIIEFESCWEGTVHYKKNTSHNGLSRYSLINIPIKYGIKSLPKLFSLDSVSTEYCREFLNYLKIWDGFTTSKNAYGYSNTDRPSIDLVQAYCTLGNCRSTITVAIDNRKDTYSTCYKVHWNNSRNTITTQVFKNLVISPYDGNVYCFQMPKGTLITRRKGRVLISGNSCAPDVQVASYALILDRKVGNHYLHDNVYLVAAGNKDTDKAVTNPMSTALVSRLVHLELDLDTETWLDWARGKIDDRIISFITYRPDLLSTFDDFDKEDTLTYGCPRSWEMLSNLLKVIPKIGFDSLELFNGVVGTKASQSFVTFCKVYSDIPSYKDIVSSPRGIEVSERGDINSAIVTVLNSQVSRTDIDKVTLYVNRLPIEYQCVFFQTLTKNNKLLLITESVKSWMSNNYSLFN